MSEMLAVILFIVLVFGGPVGCGIKALLGMRQRNFLPKKFTNELKEGKSIILSNKESGT